MQWITLLLKYFYRGVARIFHKLVTCEVGHGNEIDNVKLTILSDMAHEMFRI